MGPQFNISWDPSCIQLLSKGDNSVESTLYGCKAHNGDDREIAHPLYQNYMKGTYFLECYFFYIHTMDVFALQYKAQTGGLITPPYPL